MIDAKWIKNHVLNLGADDCGLVSLAEQPAASWHEQIFVLFPGVKTVIVFHKKFPRFFYEPNEIEIYNQDFNDMIFSVNLVAQKLTKEMESAGCRAQIIDSDDEIEPDRGAISLRHYAALAGLGTLGKNNLLLTSRFGSMVLLGAVLTDLALEGDGHLEKELCIPGCSQCIQACPQQALGENGRTKVDRCKGTVTPKDDGDTISECWQCRYTCPLNRMASINTRSSIVKN